MVQFLFIAAGNRQFLTQNDYLVRLVALIPFFIKYSQHHIFKLPLFLFGKCGNELQQIAHKRRRIGDIDYSAGFFRGKRLTILSRRIKFLIVFKTAHIIAEITVANRQTRQRFRKFFLRFHFLCKMLLQIIIHRRIGKIAVVFIFGIKLDARKQSLS